MDQEAYLKQIAETRLSASNGGRTRALVCSSTGGSMPNWERHEWVMNRERIPVAEYGEVGRDMAPKERPARE